MPVPLPPVPRACHCRRRRPIHPRPGATISTTADASEQACENTAEATAAAEAATATPETAAAPTEAATDVAEATADPAKIDRAIR